MLTTNGYFFMRDCLRMTFSSFVIKILLITAVACIQVSGASVESLVGDRDCFGLKGPCPPGSLLLDNLGGQFFGDWSSVNDPTFTDRWIVGTVTFQHIYRVPLMPSKAILEFTSAGLADDLGPWDVRFDGFKIGIVQVNTRPDNFQEVVVHRFAVPFQLLTGNDTITIAVDAGLPRDGFALDYSSLRITPVPEVGSAGLFLSGGSGVLLVVLWRRRKWCGLRLSRT